MFGNEENVKRALKSLEGKSTGNALISPTARDVNSKNAFSSVLYNPHL